jgi:hypothetical protein
MLEIDPFFDALMAAMLLIAFAAFCGLVKAGFEIWTHRHDRD